MLEMKFELCAIAIKVVFFTKLFRFTLVHQQTADLQYNRTTCKQK